MIIRYEHVKQLLGCDVVLILTIFIMIQQMKLQPQDLVENFPKSDGTSDRTSDRRSSDRFSETNVNLEILSILDHIIHSKDFV